MSSQPIPTAKAEVPTSQSHKADLSISTTQIEVLLALFSSDHLVDDEETVQYFIDALTFISRQGIVGINYINDIFQYKMKEVIENVLGNTGDMETVLHTLVENVSPSPF